MQGELGGVVSSVPALPSQMRITRMLMCRTESFVDDLRTGQGVVDGRAASSLRSIKTSPYQAGGFVTPPDGEILQYSSGSSV